MWRTTSGIGDGKVYDAEVIRIGAAQDGGKGTVHVKWIEDGKRSTLNSDHIFSSYKIGDQVRAVWRDTNGKGNGRVYDAKVLMIAAEDGGTILVNDEVLRKGTILVKWPGEGNQNQGSIL